MKNMRYRFLAAGLTLSLVISCASCGKKKTDESSAERIDEETVNSNGREGSSETSSNQPMTPEEIASHAHAVRWFDYFSREKGVEWGLKEEICIEDFPNVLFQWTTFADTYEFGSRIMATTDQGTEEILKERVTKDYILTCEEYGISMYLLVKRAALAGIISSSLEKNFYIRANKAGYQTNEPVHIKDPESPTLLRQLVYRAVNEEGLSMARGAELLGTSIAEMEQFCGLAVT